MTHLGTRQSRAQPLPPPDNLHAGNQTSGEVSKYIVHMMHNIEPSSVHSQYRDSQGTGIPAAAEGRCMGAQDTAVPCRAAVQEISSGHTEVRTLARSGFHMLDLQPHPSAEPTGCRGVHGYGSLSGGGGGCKGRHRLPAHQRRYRLQDTEVEAAGLAQKMAKWPTGQKND